MYRPEGYLLRHQREAAAQLALHNGLLRSTTPQRRQSAACLELAVVPVSPQIDLPFLPMVYDISVGVRREDTRFKEKIAGILVRRDAEIQRILADYGITDLRRPARSDDATVR